MLRRIINRICYIINPIKFCKKAGVSIGENCVILSKKYMFGSEPYLIKIGDHVRINDGVKFITHDGSVFVLRKYEEFNLDFKEKRRENKETETLEDIDLFGSITIGNNVQIGENAMIMPNVSIGNNVIIGACAVVTRNVPDNSVVAGIPARVIESVDDFYEKHKKDFLHTKKMTGINKKKYVETYILNK